MAPRYDIERELGHGGTASVFLAQDRKLNRPVALKVLRPEIAAALGKERFLQEVDIGANLAHPHILPILDAGEADGLLYFTMPYVEGESLHERLRREKQLPTEDALRITTEVAYALAYAHERGVLHRDIKPGNILLEAGQAVVADFGLAKVKEARAAAARVSGATTESGIAVGTPHYMSPEQWGADADVDERSDLYSLGCVLYEMLTGEPPFTGPDWQSLRSKHSQATPPSIQVVRPSVPTRIDALYRRALEKTPADRFPSAAEFAAAIERAAKEPGPVQRVAERIAGWSLPARVVTAVGALGATVVIVWGGARALLPTGPVLDPHRVVVDLFENRTGEPSLEGIRSMPQLTLSHELSRAAMQVVPILHAHQAAQFIRDTSGTVANDPIRALARLTGAGTVVTGAIEREGDRVRVHAQIVNAVTGLPVGSAIEPVVAPADSMTVAIQALSERVVGALYVAFDLRLPHLAAASPPTPEAWVEFDEALHHYIDHQWDDALEHFYRAYALDTTFVPALLYAALNHSNLGQWRAADSLLSAVAARRDILCAYDQHWLEYRRALLRGDHERALRAIRSAAELGPGSKASYNLGVEAFETRHLEEAREVLQSLDPEGPVLRGWASYWFALTNTLHALGRHREELRAARRAQRLYPDRVEPQTYELVALAGLGRVDAVLQRLDLFATSAVDSAALPMFRDAADELAEHGHVAAAREVFQRALAWHDRLPPGDRVRPEVVFERALTLCGLEQWEEAAALVRPLVDASPQDFRYLGQLGVIAAHLGDPDGAREATERLAALDGTYLFALHTAERARIAAASGDVAGATELLEAAFEEGYPYNLGIHRSRDFQRLRDHPPFAMLLTPRR